MGRKFEVHADLEPHLTPNKLPRKVIIGSFSFGAYDAAEAYIISFLPDYQLIPGGVSYTDSRRFDAINHNIGYGASIWVKEVI